VSNVPAARSHWFALVRRASGWVAAVLVGLAGAVLTTVAAAIFDGVPTDDYGLGDQFAFFVLLVLMSMGLPTAALLLYALGRGAEWSIIRSLALVHAGIITAGGTIVALWLLST
jgi:hypothetical protein